MENISGCMNINRYMGNISGCENIKQYLGNITGWVNIKWYMAWILNDTMHGKYIRLSEY